MTDWSGRYRLVYGAELREWYEAQLRTNTQHEAEVARALEEAEREALVAEVTITEDGTICSRAGDVEYYRAPLALDGNRATFTKPTGAAITLELGAGELVAHEPGKPPMKFTRVAARLNPASPKRE